MLNKYLIKLIKSLEHKKYREIENLFIAEGEKLTRELFNTSSYSIATLLATKDWIAKNANLSKYFPQETIIISCEQMKQISLLKTPQEVLCLVEIPKPSNVEPEYSNNLTLVLDKIQDPGNAGTIIRISDWFGIDNIVCSEDTVDIYNPKVVQATMGSIFRVKIKYEPIEPFLNSLPHSVPVYGASLDGEDLYNSKLTGNGIIIMGNESKGINSNLLPYIHKQIFIPFYPKGRKRTESLNVGVATAIICAEFRRRQML